MSKNPAPVAPALKDLQRQLRFDITHADFLAGAAPESTAWIKAGPPLAREARVEIYSDAWFLRLLGALEEDFGSVKRLLGDAAFERVVRHYLARHPSRTHTLTHVGAEFAEFLEGGAAGAQSLEASALARLEYGWVTSFHAAEAAPWNVGLLTTLGEEAIAALQLRLEAHAVVVSTDVAVHGFWMEEAAAPAVGAEQVLLWRRGGTVMSRVLGSDEAWALTALKRPLTLDALLQLCGEERFLPWLTAWCEARLITVEV